jgi:hypothetical protein
LDGHQWRSPPRPRFGRPTPGASDQFGYSVALGYLGNVALDALGNQVLIGAPYQNNAQGATFAAPN